MLRPFLLLLALSSAADAAANNDGMLDPDYGDGGRQVLGYLESDTLQLRDVAHYAPSGRTWLFGDDPEDRNALYLARLLVNGQPDPAFGPGGDGRRRLTLPANLIAQVEALSLDGAVMQADGKPIVFGGLTPVQSEPGAYPAFVCRLNAAGLLDGSFDGDGCRLVRSFLAADEVCRATDAAFDADGLLVVIGNCKGKALSEQPFVARLTSNGAFDLEFGAGVGLVAPAPTSASILGQHYEALVLRPDGRMVVAGTFDQASNNLVDSELGLVQLDGGGSYDPTFNGTGYRAFVFDLGGDNDDIARDIALRADGRILALGEAAVGTSGVRHALLAQLAADGTLDLAFGPGGKRVDTFTGAFGPSSRLASLEIDDRDRAIVAGSRVDGQADAPIDVGTDFWLAFPLSIPPETAPRLRISSDSATSGMVTNPAFDIAIPFSVSPGVVTEITLPIELMYFSFAEDSGVVNQRALHITANAPISVLAKGGRIFSIDTFTATPSPKLGREYRVQSWGPGLGAGSQLVVVAAHPGTRVTITPTITVAGHPAGVPFDVNLQPGQAVHLFTAGGQGDLTGTTVVSDRPTLVLAGHSCAQVPNTDADFCDTIFETQRPVDTWGTRFFAVPEFGRVSGDVLRVLAHESGTRVSIDGNHVAILAAGQHYDATRTTATQITATRPVAVAQLAQGCKLDGDDACLGDPFVMNVLPMEHWQRRWHAHVPDKSFADQSSYVNYLSIVAPSTAIGSIRIDGVVLPAAGFTAIGNSGFVQQQVVTTTGMHVVSAAEPVAVNVYGYAASESYGHVAAAVPSPTAAAIDADDVVVRYRADMERDPTFGSDGVAVIDHRPAYGTPIASLDRAQRAIPVGNGILAGSASRNGASEQSLFVGYRLEAGNLFRDGFEGNGD